MKKNNDVEEPTLRSLREAAGFTQGELAKELGLGNRIISDWETGKKIPKFDNAVSLATALKVSLKSLARSMNMNVSNLPSDSKK